MLKRKINVSHASLKKMKMTPFKMNAVREWLKQCPELKEHCNVDFNLVHDGERKYSFEIPEKGIVHITPQEIFLQNNKRTKLTTHEPIHVQPLDGGGKLYFDVKDGWEELEENRDRTDFYCGVPEGENTTVTESILYGCECIKLNCNYRCRDSKRIRTRPLPKPGETPALLKYGLFDDELEDMPCLLFHNDANLFDWLKHDKCRVLTNSDIDFYTDKIKLYCENRRMAYDEQVRRVCTYFSYLSEYRKLKENQIRRLSRPSSDIEKTLRCPYHYVVNLGALGYASVADARISEDLWNEMHLYRPPRFIDKVDEALNRCSDELQYLKTPEIRYIYCEIVKRRPRMNLKAIINNQKSLLQELIMILVDEYDCIRNEVTGDGHKCSIYMYDGKKRSYKHVASSMKNFIPFILECIHVEEIIRIYRSIRYKNEVLDNIESMWAPKPVEQGYYGYNNGVFDFREGVFYAYKEHYLPFKNGIFFLRDKILTKYVDANRVKLMETDMITYKYFDTYFQQSDMYVKNTDAWLYDVKWSKPLHIDTIFKTQKFSDEDVALLYAVMIGRSLLPVNEDNHDAASRLAGDSRVGKTILAKSVTHYHPTGLWRKHVAKQDKRWGMCLRGSNFNWFDESWKLNCDIDTVKEKIDGGIQQEPVPNKGMKTFDITGPSLFNANDDGQIDKLFMWIQDPNGAADNRLPTWNFRYSKEEEDNELLDKINSQPETLDRASQAYRLFKTMKGAWYENLSEKSSVFQSWQSRVDMGKPLDEFMKQYTIIGVSEKDTYNTLARYNPKITKLGAVFNECNTDMTVLDEMKRRCGHDGAKENILYRVPLYRLKRKYLRYLRQEGKRVSDADKVFGLEETGRLKISGQQKLKLWHKFKIYVKSVQSGSNDGSIIWAMGVKLK